MTTKRKDTRRADALAGVCAYCDNPISKVGPLWCVRPHGSRIVGLMTRRHRAERKAKRKRT